MTRLLRFVALTAAIAAGTWVLGWSAVPAVALIAGVIGVGGGAAAAAAASAWGLILVIDAVAGRIGTLSTLLAGVMGMPVPVLLVVTLLLPALLAWSAASLGNAARAIRATSRPPS